MPERAPEMLAAESDEALLRWIVFVFVFAVTRGDRQIDRNGEEEQ